MKDNWTLCIVEFWRARAEIHPPDRRLIRCGVNKPGARPSASSFCKHRNAPSAHSIKLLAHRILNKNLRTRRKQTMH